MFITLGIVCIFAIVCVCTFSIYKASEWLKEYRVKKYRDTHTDTQDNEK